jgi:exonuclease SbcD
VRVFLHCERPLPGLADQVREILPNAVEVRLEYAREAADERPVDVAALAPRELLQRYHRDRHGAEAEAELLDLFDRLLDEVTAT